MTAPAVSVILPAFNRVGYLRTAVESVFAQTLADWELIIADDGSDEETKAYLRSLEGNARIKLILLPHSGNPSAVRNAAMRAARGLYIAFLDSDDLWRPSKLERQIDMLNNRGNRRWVYTAYDCIDDLGETLTLPSPRAWIPYRGAVTEPLLRLDASVATAAVLVERRLLLQVGGFDEELPMFEHYDLWLRLAQHSELELIDEPLTCLRVHADHYSKQGLPMLEGRRALLAKVLGRTPDPYLRRVAQRLYARSVLNIASMRADTDRIAAMKVILDNFRELRGIEDWWTGIPRVLMKAALPRRALVLYRRMTS